MREGPLAGRAVRREGGRQLGMDGESVRIDRWLCAARLYKSRALAARACVGGHVRLNGRPAKAHSAVRVGDRIEARVGPRLRIVVVRGLAERRLSPPAARELYEDRSPPPPPPEERPAGGRPRGAGRPSRADRRALRRLRGRF